MTNTDKKRQSGCPVTFGLDTFGDRWSLLVIREMILNGKNSYSEFMEIEEKIASNILIARLKHLQTEGIINKTRDPDNRRRYIYTLSEKGRDLVPIILEIIAWSGKYDERPFALRDVLKEIKKNRKEFEKKLRRE